MLRFDLINKDKDPKNQYRLISSKQSQRRRRRRRRWIWGTSLLALLAVGAGYLWQNPEIAEPYVDIPALTARVTQGDVGAGSTTADATESEPEAESVAAVVETPTSTAAPTPEPTSTPTAVPTALPTATTAVVNAALVDDSANSTLANTSIGLGSVALQLNNVTFAVVGSDGATILNAPGGTDLTALEAGAFVDVSGRTENGQWVMISSRDGVSGWTPARSLLLFDVEALPVTSDSTAEVPEMAGASAADALMDTASSQAEASQAESSQMEAMSETTEPEQAPSASAPAAASQETTTAQTGSAQPASAASRSTQRRSVLAVVRGNGATLRNSPSGGTLRSLPVGTMMSTTGRDAAGTWLFGETRDGDAGWVAADRVVAFGQEDLPQVDASGAAIGTGSAGASNASASGSAPAGSAAASVSSARRPAPANPRNLPIATVATDGSRLNIRGGPGTQYAIVGKAQRGEQFVVIGQSANSGWYQIEVPDLGNRSAWISARYATLDRAASGVPQAAAPAQPAAQAAPTPATVAAQPSASIAAPATVSLQPDRRGTNNALYSPPGPNASGLAGKLVFQQKLGGPIYVYNFAGGSLRQLTAGMDPAISPDGQRVAFGRFGGDGGVYTIDINGANERRLYTDTTVRSPKWSPDGKWIVFSRLTGEYQCRNLGFGICLQNNPFLSQFTLDSKEERGLTRIDSNGGEFRDIAALNTAYTPDWNENGIVYQAVTSIEITKDEPDADTEAVLKQTIGYQDPDWQPNGGRIVFQGQQTSHWQIFSVQPNGGGLQALTKPVTALVDQMPSNVSPAFSPDGRHIVYLSNRDAGEEAGAWRLWVMDADGANQRPLPIDVAFDYAFNREQMVSWGQ